MYNQRVGLVLVGEERAASLCDRGCRRSANARLAAKLTIGALDHSWTCPRQLAAVTMPTAFRAYVTPDNADLESPRFGGTS